MSKQKFNAYGVSERVTTEIVGESLTQQHFAQEADVRNIIKQYDRTGLIANVNRGVARYGDYSEVNEYAENLRMVQAAQASFMELPAEIREKFGNDPGNFFEFATDPKNHEAMVNLGLAERPVEAVVEETQGATEPPAPQEAGE